MKKLTVATLALLIIGVINAEETQRVSVIGKTLLNQEKVDLNTPRPEVDRVPHSKRPEPRKFPIWWGKPPMLQTKDIRPLPGGFGMGSSTLAHWISNNLKKDDIAKPIIEPRPKPPVKPTRPPAVLKKIELLREKQREMSLVRAKLMEDLKGKSKKTAMLLVRDFKEANKQKHLEIKEAQKAVIEDIRARKQTGERRD